MYVLIGVYVGVYLSVRICMDWSVSECMHLSGSGLTYCEPDGFRSGIFGGINKSWNTEEEEPIAYTYEPDQCEEIKIFISFSDLKVVQRSYQQIYCEDKLRFSLLMFLSSFLFLLSIDHEDTNSHQNMSESSKKIRTSQEVKRQIEIQANAEEYE